jgi:hypothetical protein
VIFLRYQLLAAEIKFNLVKVEAIQKIKAPVDISEVRKFLELSFYYWKLIRNYFKITELLNAIL